MPDRESFLGLLGASAPVGLAAFDRELRYVAVNEWIAATNGVPAEDHEGRSFRDLIDPATADAVEPILRGVVDTGVPALRIPIAGVPRGGERPMSAEVSYFPLHDGAGERIGVGCVVVDTTDRQLALERVALLQEAIASATTAPDAELAARAIVENAIAAVGAYGSGIAFAMPDGEHLEFVAVSGRFADTTRSRYRVIPLAVRAPATVAFRERRIVWLPTADDWKREYPDGSQMVDDGARAALAVPLALGDGGRPLGILGLVFDHDVYLSPDDFALVTSFAQQAAQALERVMLQDLQRVARERFELLATLGARLDEEIGLHARVEAFLDAIVPSFTDTAAVELHGDDGTPTLRVARRTEATTAEWATSVPLAARGDRFGTVFLSSRGAADLDLAVELARRLATALDNARLYERERAIAETLQQSLLPERVPTIAGVVLWARYLPGTDLVVGGDFWDVIGLEGGRALLVVGDVAGRGERAAIIMGRLRTVVRASSRAIDSPADLLATLNRFLVEHEDEMVTCVCGVLDYGSGRLTLANAGHMPVLVVRAGGRPEWVTAATGLPLGVRDLASYEELVTNVATGDTVVMFTDGLVERRHEAIDSRLGVLADVAAAAIAAGDDWCDRVVERMIGSRREDDVAVLGVRIDHLLAAPLSIRLPAEPARLRSVRRQFRGWLSDHGVAHDDAESLLLAVGEAIANVIVHAYGNGSGELRVDANVDGGVLRVRVEDDGRWRPPRDDEGRGLQIIRGLCEDVEIVTGASGTMLTFARQLRAGSGQAVN